MRSSGVKLPRISRPVLRLFAAYVRLYVRRNLHTVRVSRIPNVPANMPVIVCLNHPSWWDPLIALLLATRLFPDRSHYAPIEAAALTKYKFFERIGFFGIEAGTPRGAAQFLRTGEAILRCPESVLWVTAQGTFVDPRIRPIVLRPGVGHLIHRLTRAIVLPLALEYPFWEERFPEALAVFGDPIVVADGAARKPDEWIALLASALETAQDELAELSTARDSDAFRVLIDGRSGVGGAYDFWRALKSWSHGRRFQRGHGAERL